DQRKATAEILRVISQSPSEMRPVFQAIVDSAVKLCDAAFGGLIRWHGGLMTIGAISSQTRPAAGGAFEEIYPLPVTPRSRLVGLAIRERRVVQIDDVQAAPDVLSAAQNRRLVQAQGYRTFLAVPLLRGDACFGAISLWRRVVAPFSEQHIALLQTFADQAVIAIENVRLFKELQTSNRELTTALDKQTATSDILSVISRSQTDVQPVFEAILSSAVRLLGAYTGALTRVVDNQIELVAFTRTDDAGAAALRAAFPQSLQSDLPHAQAIRDRAPLNIADAQTDPRLPEAEHVRARVRGFRSRVLVPLLRHGESIGAISVARREPGGFNADEISLLQTFADQAVIAIEDVRLFKE